MNKNLRKKVLTFLSLLPIPSLAFSADLELERLNAADIKLPNTDGSKMEQEAEKENIEGLLLNEINPDVSYEITTDQAFANFTAKHPDLTMDEANEEFEAIISGLIANGIVVTRDGEGATFLATVVKSIATETVQ